MAQALAELVCGLHAVDTELGEMLSHQGTVVDYLYEIGLSIRGRAPNDSAVSLLGPTVGRGILEVCSSTLLARIDPFRLLTLRATQLADSGIQKKNELSIQWTGDIQPRDKKPEVMWSIDRSPDKLTRALLGHYYDEIFWKPAFRRTVDALSTESTSQTIAELKLYEHDRFVPTLRNRMSTLYSSCSKGLHHEFVIPIGSLYDLPTVRNFMTEAREMVLKLAIVANLSDAILFPVAKDRVIELVEQIEAEEF